MTASIAAEPIVNSFIHAAVISVAGVYLACFDLATFIDYATPDVVPSGV